MIKNDENKNLIDELRESHQKYDDPEEPALGEISNVDGITQFILCNCGDISVSFPIEDVRELVATGELAVSFLPSLKPPNIGIVRRKGDLIPLASLSEVLDSGQGNVSKTTGRAVICHMDIDGKSDSFGLLVDEVVAVVAVDNASLSSISQKVSDSESMDGAILKKVFSYEDNDYRVIDTVALYSFLAGTIERRNVSE